MSTWELNLLLMSHCSGRLSESKPSGIRPLVKLPAKLYLHILIPSDIHTCRSEYLQNRIPAKLNPFLPESLQTRIPAELNTCRIEYLLTWMPADANTCRKWIPAELNTCRIEYLQNRIPEESNTCRTEYLQNWIFSFVSNMSDIHFKFALKWNTYFSFTKVNILPQCVFGYSLLKSKYFLSYDIWYLIFKTRQTQRYKLELKM